MLYKFHDINLERFRVDFKIENPFRLCQINLKTSERCSNATEKMFYFTFEPIQRTHEHFFGSILIKTYQENVVLS